jgi:aminoglycoside 3-N-acetyltransferase
MSIGAKVQRKHKLWLKARLFEVRRWVARTVFSYDGPTLIAGMRSLGVQAGDTVLLHSSFEEHHGFRGNIQDVIDVFIDAVGPDGNLLMVSLPYRSSSLQYLSKLKRFDVRKTPSMMGMVSELFRRRPGVMRSLSPTHPMLVHGPKAAWLIADHETCQHPCGPGSPFEKLVICDAKAVFFNTSFDAFTFFHYLEHLVSSEMQFSLYTDKPFQAQVVNAEGVHSIVPTYAFAVDAMRRRRFGVLEAELRRRGVYFYDLTDLPHAPGGLGSGTTGN